MEATKAFAAWAAETPTIISKLALLRARHAIQDVVACMVAGAGDEGSARLRSAIASYGNGSGPATIIGTKEKTSAPWAALANGMAAHALDYDDNYLPGFTHASAVSIPALLALAEEIDATGQQMMDAYIVGLEMQACIGRGINRAHYDKGWHATSTVGCIGTAAACGRLLGLDRNRLANAISLGVSMASGAKVQFGTMTKPFHAGMAAKNAVLAARLASNDFEARDVALEGPLGFLELYGDTGSQGWDDIIPKIGNPLAIEEFGLAPKLYPCCGSVHRVLDVVLELRENHGITANDVAKVETLVEYGNKRNLMYDSPEQEMEARFSMNYCVAVALLNGRLSLLDFTPQAIHRPEVRMLLPLVSMDAYEKDAQGSDPTVRLPHKATILLKDGRTLSGDSAWARGTIHNPFDESDRWDKFQDCCEGFISTSDLNAAREILDELETLDSVRRLTRHLIFEAGSDRGERFSQRFRQEKS